MIKEENLLQKYLKLEATQMRFLGNNISPSKYRHQKN